MSINGFSLFLAHPVALGVVGAGIATTMNGILSDSEKIQGVTIKYNEVMDEMGIQVDQEDNEIDESFVRQVLKFGMFWELICAILVDIVKKYW